MSTLRSIMRVSLIAAAVVPLGNALEAGREPAAPWRPLNAYDRAAIERVKVRAAARLEDASCREILTDFKDDSGRTLESNLEALGVSASGYLLQLSFLDGSVVHECRNLAVAMVAAHGAPRVFLCPAEAGPVNSRISRIEFQRGSLAEAMVIHEMLHTLGLGENPPTTFEITERVRARCH